MKEGLLFTKQETTSGALSYTLEHDTDIEIKEIRLHLSAEATQDTLTVTVNNTGTAFDTVLIKQDMVGVQDYVYLPPAGPIVRKDSQFVVSFDNTDELTVGLEITYVGLVY